MYKMKKTLSVRTLNELLNWYSENKRDLPWRTNALPYSVMLSEIMLQQTTSTAVVPFQTRFLEKFPTIQNLAEASLDEIYECWAGLGYYSRARNLHKAAKIIVKNSNFPNTYQQWLELPGFGPYTARSVASIAFGERVGVLDGNVIRVLTRLNDLNWAWWRNKERGRLQALVDEIVNLIPNIPSGEINQALMELGSQICKPKNPKCISCPLLSGCQAKKLKRVDKRPIKRPTKRREIWFWQPYVVTKSNQILLVKNNYAPFLRSQWFLPGTARKVSERPKEYDFCHAITHHDIFVRLKHKKVNMKSRKINNLATEKQWVKPTEIKRFIPASLVTKALKNYAQENRAPGKRKTR